MSLVPRYPVGAGSRFPQEEGEFRFSGRDTGTFQITPLTQPAFFKVKAGSAGAVAKSLLQRFGTGWSLCFLLSSRLSNAHTLCSRTGPAEWNLSIRENLQPRTRKPRSEQGWRPSLFILLTRSLGFCSPFSYIIREVLFCVLPFSFPSPSRSPGHL